MMDTAERNVPSTELREEEQRAGALALAQPLSLPAIIADFQGIAQTMDDVIIEVDMKQVNGATQVTYKLRAYRLNRASEK